MKIPRYATREDMNGYPVLNADEIQEAIGYFIADWKCYEDWDEAYWSTINQFIGCEHVNGLRLPSFLVSETLFPILWEVARPLHFASHGEILPKTIKEYRDQIDIAAFGP